MDEFVQADHYLPLADVFDGLLKMYPDEKVRMLKFDVLEGRLCFFIQTDQEVGQKIVKLPQNEFQDPMDRFRAWASSLQGEDLRKVQESIQRDLDELFK